MSKKRIRIAWLAISLYALRLRRYFINNWTFNQFRVIRWTTHIQKPTILDQTGRRTHVCTWFLKKCMSLLFFHEWCKYEFYVSKEVELIGVYLRVDEISKRKWCLVIVYIKIFILCSRHFESIWIGENYLFWCGRIAFLFAVTSEKPLWILRHAKYSWYLKVNIALTPFFGSNILCIRFNNFSFFLTAIFASII